jgi:RND family efflux transporter MFP subunit
MSETKQKSPTGKRSIVTIVLCVVVIVVTLGIIVYIQATEPKAQRTGATRKSAALVETAQVTNGVFSPLLEALGTVEAEREVYIRPQVSGSIVEVSPSFVPGGFVRKGEVLVKIDSADFENTLAMRKSELEEAEAALAIEEGRRAVAEKEFALLDEDVSEENRPLVLREPQIASAQARVASARAAVKQAALHLSRTHVRAPFDAHILSRDANLGSQVSTSDRLAHLVGTDAYWVSTTVPLRDLQRIRFADGKEQGSAARIAHRAAWSSGVVRDGTVERLIGMVDDQTRLARVLVRVEDPLAREQDAPALVLGAMVEVHIEGREIENVVRVNRSYIRDGDTIWLYVDGQLEIRALNIVFEDSQYAYVTEGLRGDEEVVTTSLASASPGIGLQRISDSDDGVSTP